MKSNVCKSNLSTLKQLVDELTDRDVKVKRDVQLFEEFFSNFPIPVTIWAISSEGTVISQKGNGLVCPDASCLETLFLGNKNKDLCVDMHKDALTGKSRQEIVTHNRKMYYTSVVPRRNDQGEVSGVAGLAWDVSPNYTIIKHLEEIQSLTESSLEDVSSSLTRKVRDKAKKALSESRLYKILNGNSNAKESES